MLPWLLLPVCWYCKRWIKFALGWGIVGVIPWVILFLHILHHRTDIYSMHDLKRKTVEAYLDLKWYRILLGQTYLSSAFGRFLTRVNYQSIAIAAPAMLFGRSLPLGLRTDAEEVNPSCNCPSRDRYGFTFDLSSSGLYLANIVELISPRCRITITSINDANAKALDAPLVSGPWCLPDKMIVCSLTLVNNVVSTASYIDVFADIVT